MIGAIRLRSRRRLDHEHQPHRRFLQFHRDLRVRELRAVDDVRPMNEFLEVRRSSIAENVPCATCAMNFVHDL